MSNKNIVCIVGNPNCGKTTLFNALTGARQAVGNWPGVTVEKKVGFYTHKNQEIEIVDLPGIYSVTPSSNSGEDERVARDYILSDEAQAVINIVDASNLERNLYLTAQLIEMRVPVLVVVNMLDIAKQHKMEIKLDELSKALHVPVVGICANVGEGVEQLKDRINEFVAHAEVPPMSVTFDPRITKAGEQIADLLKTKGMSRPYWFALQLLEGAPGIAEKLPVGAFDEVKKIIDPLEKDFDGDLDIAVADGRYQFVSKVAEQATHRTGTMSTTLTDKIDRVVLNRWAGIPIFLFMMYILFLFTQNLGGAFIDFFDTFVGGVLVDGVGGLLDEINCPQWLHVIIADGIGGGLQTVSTFIPVIFFLFFFLAILEDSGYMARAAFVMDRLMRSIGLPGKAFVPLIVGFGCNVPAIMATRTMDKAADRLITIAMCPFMSCGARLPVYVLFATAFFPTNGQNLVFALYLIGIVAAVFTGWCVKRFALPGDVSSFVMEIPPYHLPTFKGVMLRTWDRLKAFLNRATRVIVAVVVVISFLNSWGTDGSFGNDDTDKSVLSAIGRTIVPAFYPMGVEQENWPAAVGIFTGILAKEAVVGTMNNLYNGMAQAANAKAAAAKGGDDAKEGGDEEKKEEPFSFWGTVSSSFVDGVTTVRDNLLDLGSAITDPLGIEVGDLSDTKQAAEDQEVDVDSIEIMQHLFPSQFAAFCYLLMVLLYVPCIVAVATIYREAGAAWAVFMVCWTLVLGWSAATIVYRIGTFAQAPLYASICIAVAVVLLGGMLGWMARFAKKNVGKGPKVIPIASAQ